MIPHRNVDTGEEFTVAERFANIVCRASFQSFNSVVLSRSFPADDENRRVGKCCHSTNDINAVPGIYLYQQGVHDFLRQNTPKLFRIRYRRCANGMRPKKVC